MKKMFLSLFICMAILLTACGTDNPSSTVDSDNSSVKNQSSESDQTSSFYFDIESYKKEHSANSEGTTSQNVRGRLIDCSGNVISYSEPDGNLKYVRRYSEESAEAFAPFISDFSSGVDSINDSVLREENIVDTPNDEGQSLRLTLDSNKQIKIYKLLNDMGLVGAVVALNDKGALITAVSTPSYDPNLYCDDPEYADKINNSPNTPLVCKAIERRTPGSVFKMISCTLAEKHNFTGYYDQGYLSYQGSIIKNWDYGASYYPQQRDLVSLFINSSNSGFAQCFLDLPDETIFSECRELFYLADDIKIKTDFGVIENSLMLTDKARSGFGQSDVRLSPVYVAMLTIGTVTGNIPQPYCVNASVNTLQPGEIIEQKDPKKTLSTIPLEYRTSTIEGMRGIAQDLNLNSLNTAVYAKTGTAEIDNQEDTLWIASCIQIPNSDELCSVVLQVRNPKKFGYTYASSMSELIIEIINIIVGSDH